jgi:hypothetical protein
MVLCDAVHLLEHAGHTVLTYGQDMAVAKHGRRNRLYLSNRFSFMTLFVHFTATAEELAALPERMQRIVGESLGRDVARMVTCLDMVEQSDPDFEKLAGADLEARLVMP